MHETDAGVPANHQAAADADALPSRRQYAAPQLVALDLRLTQGDTGIPNDGLAGSLLTSGGGPT